MPRSSSVSSTSRRLRLNRIYSQTAWAKIEGGNRCRVFLMESVCIAAIYVATREQAIAGRLT